MPKNASAANLSALLAQQINDFTVDRDPKRKSRITLGNHHAKTAFWVELVQLAVRTNNGRARCLPAAFFEPAMPIKMMRRIFSYTWRPEARLHSHNPPPTPIVPAYLSYHIHDGTRRPSHNQTSLRNYRGTVGPHERLPVMI